MKKKKIPTSWKRRVIINIEITQNNEINIRLFFLGSYFES